MIMTSNKDVPKPFIGVREMLPLKGFPSGKIRIRMRPEEFAIAFVRTSEGVFKYAIGEKDGYWHPAILQGSNFRSGVTDFSLNELADMVHELAWEKGWHDDNISEDAFVESATNNLHNEVSELHEAWRNNKLRDWCDKAQKMITAGIVPLTCLEEELADILIRVLDNARRLKVDIQKAVICKHQFNETRPYRHGGKRS